jgi:hypothetical protein
MWGQARSLPPPEYMKTKHLIGKKMEIHQILKPKIKIPNKRCYILKILGRPAITIFLNGFN